MKNVQIHKKKYKQCSRRFNIQNKSMISKIVFKQKNIIARKREIFKK